MGFFHRSNRKASTSPEARTIPEPAKTLGHHGAICFTQAILDGRWIDAEELFFREGLVDQAHMVSVASDLGGDPATLEPWVQLGTETGLSELLRGATSIVTAWNLRSGGRSDEVSNDVLNEFHRLLGTAEVDLHNAAELMADSSIPWKHLLTSGRGLHVNRHEMDDRYVRHIERGELLSGHMSFQQLVSSKWAGSHEEMWEHAEWISRTASLGSVNHALVAVALIEDHVKPSVRHETIRHLPALIGKSELLGAAAHKSYGDPLFDAATPEGAMALSAWFTVHYLMGNWEQAALLMPVLGDRFTRFPMSYFQDTTWPELQHYVHARLVRAA